MHDVYDLFFCSLSIVYMFSVVIKLKRKLFGGQCQEHSKWQMDERREGMDEREIQIVEEK